MIILAKINVTKIDKSKLFKGEKGTYLDIVLVETPDSKYADDYMVVQSVSKEEREKGVKGAILGNAMIVGQKPAAPAPQSGGRYGPEPTRPAAAPRAQENLDEEVQF